MNKKDLTETEICDRYITPAIVRAGWDQPSQVRREYPFTAGRVIVRGKIAVRGKAKRADYLLCYESNLPLAVVEAKGNAFPVGGGMPQALGYAQTLDVPFVFSSNGDGFLFHDRTGRSSPVETNLALDEFPSPSDLWARYRAWKGITDAEEKVVRVPYYEDASGRELRYYQRIAIQRTVEAVSRGQRRILLAMSTGTGKTYTAFQIIWRLWRAGVVRRVLFLADRNILVDQTITNDFKPFGSVMTKVQGRTLDKSYEVYLALYQAVTGTEEEKNVYKQFSPEFFDLVVIDECHRGSAKEDSAWREILDHFEPAIQLGLTATPKETREVSTLSYFGPPVYTYPLKQGIDDGFLAPFKVVRIDLDRDLQGWRPTKGMTDDLGQEIDDRVYNLQDMDRVLVLNERTKRVAERVVAYMVGTDPYGKAIVFCDDIDHAERMRMALVNEVARQIPAEAPNTAKFVVRITGGSPDGQSDLDDFIHPEKRYPVIATTSKLLTTGVDARTCKLIVLDQRIQSMIEFKQIIGRGTRIHEDAGKLWFTIMDLKKATELFADPAWDGEPVVVYEPGAGDPPVPPDGTLFGEGVKTRVKEHLLTECDLHTIVRLPKGVFAPYTSIKTNVLFFTKGGPTKAVWYYEHPYPDGAKSYSKTKPMRIEEFAPEKAWWPKRKETDRAWKVTIDQIRERGFNLDIANPNAPQDRHEDPDTLLARFDQERAAAAALREELRKALAAALMPEQG